MEHVIILLDNSEFTRNGDFGPSRIQAQLDSVSLLAGAKTQSHPESTVSLMSMAGKAPRVLLTLTQDLGKVLSAMNDVEISGESKFSASLQIASLALKHRQNKNGTARIVLFVGSPLTEDREELVKLGKKLKKNGVAVDVVSFGSDTDNQDTLAAFIESVSSGNNSRLVSVPSGGTVLADFLIGTPLFMGEEGGNPFGGAGSSGAGAGGGFEFGVDPNLDPELAMVLRLSMEEERARQQAAQGGAASGEAAAAETGPPSDAMELDEDALLQQAIALSMQQDSSAAAPPVQPSPAPEKPSAAPAPMPEDPMMGVEDEELRLALQMSMAEAEEQAKSKDEEKK